VVAIALAFIGFRSQEMARLYPETRTPREPSRRDT
jgi:hypothetical protein